MTPPSFSLHRLHVFQTVTRTQSFTGAAELLHTSQPNVSKHVAQLERELGVSLFDRLGGRVALTDAGRMVQDYAAQLFTLVEEMGRALRELEGVERGYLHLGASSTPGIYLLPPVLAGFRGQYPAVVVTFALGTSQEIVQAVLAGQLDLGFVEGYSSTPGIQVQPFMPDELVVIAPAGHRLAGHERVPAAALAGEPFIWREEGSGTRQGMERLLQNAGIQAGKSLELGSCEAVKRAVAAGLGLSVVSRLAIELEVTLGLLTILRGEELRLPRSLDIITAKQRRLPAAALAFLAHWRKGARSTG